MNARKLMIAAALLVGCITAQAQTQFGIKGGFSASWIVGTVLNGDEVVSPHNNFYAGATASWEIGDIFTLQTELLYAGKGHSDRSTLLNKKYTRTLGYLQLPVMFGVRLADDRCTLMLGPEPGYLVYAYKNDYGVESSGKEECNPFNLAAAFQVTYMIIDAVGIDAKFDWGLTRTFSDKYRGIVDDPGHNMSFQIGVCFKFGD